MEKLVVSNISNSYQDIRINFTAQRFYQTALPFQSLYQCPIVVTPTYSPADPVVQYLNTLPLSLITPFLLNSNYQKIVKEISARIIEFIYLKIKKEKVHVSNQPDVFLPNGNLHPYYQNELITFGTIEYISLIGPPYKKFIVGRVI